MGIKVQERRVSLSECHSADEVFTTGTMGELTPVIEIDGRKIGHGAPGPVTSSIQESFCELSQSGRESHFTPLPPF
ncbi:unnamed protein product [Discosporangium mesarthrocarpum]